MTKLIKLGKSGEKSVGEYIEKNGYSIICFNYHSRYGEIDIISENDKYIVFVEVKTRKSFKKYRAIEAVDRSKRIRIMKTAYFFLGENNVYKQPRFDVAEVLIDVETKIFYHENAFDVEEFDAFF